MASEKAGASDVQGAGVARGEQSFEKALAPYMVLNAECWGTDGFRWQDGITNSVCTAGLVHLANIGFCNQRTTTCGPFLYLHSAALGVSTVWNDISANAKAIQSQMSTGAPGASSYAAFTALSSSQWTAQSTSMSCDFIMSSASTVTVSGAGLFWFTANTMNTSDATGANSSLARVYNMGTFAGGSRSLQQNDTLRVTMNLSLATA